MSRFYGSSQLWKVRKEPIDEDASCVLEAAIEGRADFGGLHRGIEGKEHGRPFVSAENDLVRDGVAVWHLLVLPRGCDRRDGAPGLRTAEPTRCP